MTVIRPAVLAAWRAWNTPLEGVCQWMYLDTLGLVTTGMGNLIDPVGLALPLPWLKQDLLPATESDIVAEWDRIKFRVELAKQGAEAARAIATLSLTDAAIDALIGSKLQSFADTLAAVPEFAAFEAWPADAQMGILSMAWAMGPNFAPGWPLFRAACAAEDFATAADECWMQDNGGDIERRNVATERAFLAAERTVTEWRDFDTLYGVPP